MPAIVTKQSMIDAINNPNPAYVAAYIGRACVALFGRQTQDEQSQNVTKHHNEVGFAGQDGRQGALTAKYYLKHKKLEQWQVEKWTARDKNGRPRIAKYHRQLNEIAMEKQRKAALRHEEVKGLDEGR